MSEPPIFADRAAAGRALAPLLARFRGDAPLVLGLPRGGVPVAREVARALGAPLDVCVVRKVGLPGHEEFGMGAVAEGGEVYLDATTVRAYGISPATLRDAITTKMGEVTARAERFRHGRPPPEVRGRTVIVVDDGLATGGTARAALRSLHARGASKLILAIPVGASDSIAHVEVDADEVVCASPEDDLLAVGLWYRDFAQVEDADVIAILDAEQERLGAPTTTGATAPRSARKGAGAPPRPERTVEVTADDVPLTADVLLPAEPRAVVIIAHGSGSGRRSPRNRIVARALREAGIGCLLVDLLTADEQRADAVDHALRFDVELLGRRVAGVVDAVRRTPSLRELPIGCFGASTGAAAALIAAAARPLLVRAVVSRGGRPDLAADHLAAVRAPTLLVVGGDDDQVLALNREALAALGGPRRLAIVPGATHLFEEPGTLEQASDLAVAWFQEHLAAPASARPSGRAVTP